MKIFNQFNNQEIKKTFKKLYFTSADNAPIRYSLMHDEFTRIFGSEDYRIFSVSGRSEIGGNHTDHNNGRVLAAAVSCDTVCFAKKRNDMKVRMISYGYDGEFNVDLNDLAVNKDQYDTTNALIRGVAAGMKKNGHEICGFDAYVHSTVLSGSGLSSSAAFEVLFVKVINSLCGNDNIDAIERAQISQYAENEYFGKPSGLMDQMACSVGSLISIDFEDTKNPVVQKVEFDLSTHGYHLVVTNTGGSHADLTPDYASIPKEMREVASYFGKNVLREVDEDAFKSNILDVRKSVSDRAILRAKHFFGENTRVKKQITAISNGDIKSFLDMVIASGDSSYKLLQNIYSSKDEQGVAIGLSIAEEILKGKGAWRIHGGGFAGTILAIVPDELLEKYVEEMDNVFGKGSAAILNIRNCGAIEITI